MTCGRQGCARPFSPYLASLLEDRHVRGEVCVRALQQVQLIHVRSRILLRAQRPLVQVPEVVVSGYVLLVFARRGVRRLIDRVLANKVLDARAADADGARRIIGRGS